MNSNKPTMSNVYIFRIGQLGDTLMAIPVISKIREIHRDNNLILITNRTNKDFIVTAWDVLKHANYFRDVLFYDLSDIKNLMKMVYRLRKFKKNILYYLSSERTKKQAMRDYIFFKILCGIDKVIGIKDSIGKPVKRDEYGNLIRVDRESDRLFKLIFKNHDLNYENKLQFPLLHPSKEVYKKVESLLEKIPENSILISVGHGSKMPAKRWFTERFKELCNRLLNYDHRIYLLFLGGKEDFESSEFLRKGFESRVINLAGKTNIIESAALLEKCVLFVGNDTGTMHLAASTGIPCVCIFSARENPGKWEPMGDNHTVLRKDVDCAGCFLEECIENKMKCLDMISVDEVFGSALIILERFC